MRLNDKRLLVMGASKGIGLAIALRASREGASIAFAARSIDRFESVAEACCGPAIPIRCDVRDELSCKRAIDVTCEAFGGLDCVVYSAGITRLTELAEASVDDWLDVIHTNLVGAALTTRFAMAPLSKSHGSMIYISSSIASLNPPWRGNALYTTSKVALDHMARCWQVEHPDVNVTVLSAGPTGGTEFLKEVPSEIRRRFVNEWQANRRMQYLLDPDDLAAVVIDVLSSRTRIESLVVTPSEDPKA